MLEFDLPALLGNWFTNVFSTVESSITRGGKVSFLFDNRYYNILLIIVKQLNESLNVQILVLHISYTHNVTNTTNTNIIGPSEVWQPTSENKTITIKTTTWKRLQRYGNHFGSTYDSIITDILDEKEKREIPAGERSF